MTPKPVLDMMQTDAPRAYTPPGPRESAAALGRILLWQAGLGMLAALVIFLLGGSLAGASALIGVGICVIPNLVFAARLLPGLSRAEPHDLLRGIWGAEALKLLAALGLFVLVFKFVAPLRVDMLFAGYLATQFSLFIAAWKSD